MPDDLHTGRRVHPVAAITCFAILAIILAIIVTGCGGPPAPSAQCRRQVAQVAAYQADAKQIENSNAVFTGDAYFRFLSDVAASAKLLQKVKAEHCPESGYGKG